MCMSHKLKRNIDIGNIQHVPTVFESVKALSLRQRPDLNTLLCWSCFVCDYF